MHKDPYIRHVQTSVTCFLHCGDDYLFLKRDMRKRVDPGKLNGIGGRVDPAEDFLTAAIRETQEETGYKVSAEDTRLAVVARLEGGYSEDWVMCFFTITVPSKNIPHGDQTKDGKLLWLHKDKVLDSGHELVDDLNYVFKDLAEGNNLIFFNAQVTPSEKIENIKISKLNI